MLGFAVLVAVLIYLTLPRMREAYMQIYHMRHSLPTVTSVTSVTNSLQASPEVASQMLQWQKKAVTALSRKVCNIARAAPFSGLNDGIEVFELDTSVSGAELPLDGGCHRIATLLPGGHFSCQLLFAGDASAQAAS